MLRHSAAHLLAEAARRLYPGTKVAIGPPIENGFYYDFEFPEPVGEEALERLEEEVRREIAEGREWEREEIGRDEAKRLFEEAGEPYKVELVDTAEGDISLYRQGDFLDLCRGPHLQNAAPIKAVKLTSLAGAYWRGDETKPQLTRVYGTAFYDPKDLDEYLDPPRGGASKRDHRRLGTELDLFDFSTTSPGMPFWHPARDGDLERPRGSPPQREPRSAATRRCARRTSTTRTSGARRATGRSTGSTCSGSRSRSRDFGLKPMNCPGHCLLYSLRPHCYRELPLRLAEAGNLHRNELSGVLHGLLRVRHFVQDDAHVYCTTEQIQDELLGCLDYALLPLRPLRAGHPRRALAPARQQARHGRGVGLRRGGAPQGARRARARVRREPRARARSTGRRSTCTCPTRSAARWQLGTVQLDLQMPKRFGLTYQGEDNAEHTPAMIHRALLGSLERFVGVYLEHTGGELPVWLAPEQVRVIPVSEAARAAAAEGWPTSSGREGCASASTSGPRRSASGSAPPSWRRSRSSSSAASASRATSLAVRRHHGEQSTQCLDELAGEIARRC